MFEQQEAFVGIEVPYVVVVGVVFKIHHQRLYLLIVLFLLLQVALRLHLFAVDGGGYRLHAFARGADGRHLAERPHRQLAAYCLARRLQPHYRLGLCLPCGDVVAVLQQVAHDHCLAAQQFEQCGQSVLGLFGEGDSLQCFDGLPHLCGEFDHLYLVALGLDAHTSRAVLRVDVCRHLIFAVLQFHAQLRLVGCHVEVCARPAVEYVGVADECGHGLVRLKLVRHTAIPSVGVGLDARTYLAVDVGHSLRRAFHHLFERDVASCRPVDSILAFLQFGLNEEVGGVHLIYYSLSPFAFAFGLIPCVGTAAVELQQFVQLDFPFFFLGVFFQCGVQAVSFSVLKAVEVGRHFHLQQSYVLFFCLVEYAFDANAVLDFVVLAQQGRKSPVGQAAAS